MFNLGCRPENNERNRTLEYIANIPDVPQIFSSTVIDGETTVAVQKPKEKDLRKVSKFISRCANDESNEFKRMYTNLQVFCDDRLARHVLVIMRAPQERKVKFEEQLQKFYISMIRKPEWEFHLPQQIFIKMKLFLMNILDRVNRYSSESFIKLLQTMKEKFDEEVVRDLLVLYYTEDGKKFDQMVSYLIVKYSFEDYNPIPEGSKKHWEDEKGSRLSQNNKTMIFQITISEIILFLRVFVSKIELEEQYPINKYIHISSIKEAAEHWIDFRLKSKQPRAVEAMYRALEKKLTPRRAYELFLLSHYRMNIEKLNRIEAYLSEKYRPYFTMLAPDPVLAEYKKKEDDCMFGKTCPQIKHAIDHSNLMNPVYTKEMIDKVCDMLKKRKIHLLRNLSHKEFREEGADQLKIELLDFMYKRPNEERVRELYAMIYCDIYNWELIFYQKYKIVMELLENFEVVEDAW
uniref:Uncharacterized protein n=1 Tax=Caenorhabditis tropicalis TaxID=1561998 RepID=A0A1I7TIT3_9PELO